MSEEPGVICIKPHTNLLAIETMDAKLTTRYPVYLINEEYGGRGLNFRAANSQFGITMLIIGSFPYGRARIQTLFRVGRYGDKCKRIRASEFPEIDDDKNAEYKGQIEKGLKKIIASRVAACKKGNIPEGSPAAFADKYLTNEEFNLKYQSDLLGLVQAKKEDGVTQEG